MFVIRTRALVVLVSQKIDETMITSRLVDHIHSMTIQYINNVIVLYTLSFRCNCWLHHPSYYYYYFRAQHCNYATLLTGSPKLC